MSKKIVKGAKLTVPAAQESLGLSFFKSAEKYGDRICQIDGHTGEKETFSSVKQRSTRVAISLKKKGITSKDAIMFCANNIIDGIIPVLATLYLGAKVTHVHFALSATSIQHLIGLVDPKIIFVQDSYVDLIEESLKETNLKPEIIVLGRSDKYEVFDDLARPQEGERFFQPSEVDLQDTTFILFSSGTTSLPKAICHTHYSFQHQMAALIQYGWECRKSFSFSTLYWISGVMTTMSSFLTGGCRILGREFSPEETFKIIEKYQITSLFLSPIGTYKITTFRESQNFDTSSVITLLISGAALDPEQIKKAKAIFKQTNIIFGLGMSEAGLVAMFNPKTDKNLMESRLESCGKLMPGVKLKIVDSHTNEVLSQNQDGEVYVKSPVLTKGYYNQLDNSALFDNDGYLKTGDLGYYDEEGCLFLTGRLKEMLKYQSWQVLPSTIESAISKHEAVQEALVFGIPGGADGDWPTAYVILKENYSDVTEDEVRDFANKLLGEHEKIRGGLKFIKEFPRTPTGKVIRSKARNIFLKSM